MIEVITALNFQHYLNEVEEGYLVNVWISDRSAKAHNLTHVHGACRSTLNTNDPINYPKFFASTLQEARQYSQQHYGVTCERCKLCG